MRVHWPAPNREFGFVDALGVTGLCGFLVARFIPVAKLPFWGCFIRQYTGWPCLGCGLTRVADRMSHFNVVGALQANPLGTVFALLFMAAIVATALHLAFKMPIPSVTLTPREWFALRVGVVVAILLNWGVVVVMTRFPYLL